MRWYLRLVFFKFVNILDEKISNRRDEMTKKGKKLNWFQKRITSRWIKLKYHTTTVAPNYMFDKNERAEFDIRCIRHFPVLRTSICIYRYICVCILTIDSMELFHSINEKYRFFKYCALYRSFGKWLHMVLFIRAPCAYVCLLLSSFTSSYSHGIGLFFLSLCGGIYTRLSQRFGSM